MQDRCWIMPGKWSMGSITCLALSEEEKTKTDEGDYWRRGRLKVVHIQARCLVM